jgi:hypothetical protein
LGSSYYKNRTQIQSIEYTDGAGLHRYFRLKKKIKAAGGSGRMQQRYEIINE